ncbi:MAG: hypothetical protein V5786_05425 [Psychromonas sp.]
MNENIETVLKLRRWVSIAHHIPGRIRLKYKLGILAHFIKFSRKEMEQTVQKIPALKHYKLNTVTGSLVIEYDVDQIKPQQIEALFSESEHEAKQAYYALSNSLDIDGANL